jgi:hypothetical protein
MSQRDLPRSARSRRPRRAVPFGLLRPGQQFRLLNTRGAPLMGMIYTRIHDTEHRGERRNAVGWAANVEGGASRRYFRFAHTTPVLPDTFNLPVEPDDEQTPIRFDIDDFDPATTPGPRPGVFDPNLDDLW